LNWIWTLSSIKEVNLKKVKQKNGESKNTYRYVESLFLVN